MYPFTRFAPFTPFTLPPRALQQRTRLVSSAEPPAATPGPRSKMLAPG